MFLAVFFGDAFYVGDGNCATRTHVLITVGVGGALAALNTCGAGQPSTGPSTLSTQTDSEHGVVVHAIVGKTIVPDLARVELAAREPRSTDAGKIADTAIGEQTFDVVAGVGVTIEHAPHIVFVDGEPIADVPERTIHAELARGDHISVHRGSNRRGSCLPISSYVNRGTNASHSHILHFPFGATRSRVSA